MKASLKRVPVVTLIAVFFIFGIVIGSLITIPFFIWFGFCVFMLFAAFFLLRNNAAFLIFFLLLSLGLGAGHIRDYLVFSKNDIALVKADTTAPVLIKGVVSSAPDHGVKKVSFILRAEEIAVNNRSKKIKGMVLANVFAPLKFSYGDRLILEGRLHRPFNFGQNASFSYREYLKNQGIYYILSLRKDNRVELLETDKGNPLIARSLKIRQKFKDIFDTYLLSRNARVLSAITLGERRGFPEDIKNSFIRTGTAHIIAISGFNVGIITFLALILFKALRIKQKARYCLTIPLLIGHMYAVGAGASVARATIMALVLIFACLINRQPRIGNSLSVSALIILGCNPLQIFDIGFQLSFVSVIGIVILSPKIMNLFKANPKPGFIFRALESSFSVSLAAWLSTFGFTLYYFRIFSPVAILANLIIVPLSSLAIILGFILGLSAMFLPVLSIPIANTTNFTLAGLFKIAFFISRIPGAYFYLF